MNLIPSKVVPLRSHTPPETLLPLPVAVLEVFMWKCPRCQIRRVNDLELKLALIIK
jgi:hypothetical protein